MINFDRLTSYLLEEYFAEIGRIKQIKMKNYVVPPLGYSTNNNTLLIFQQEYLSLHDLIHSSEKQDLRKSVFDSDEKYSILIQVAKIMATFHQFNPPICHGHLTSHNIMLESVQGTKRFQVRIADLELIPIHKHQNTFGDYRNASVWSSPECL